MVLRATITVAGTNITRRAERTAETIFPIAIPRIAASRKIP
jgi:hypothetical protein